MFERASGVLMPVFSLPGKYGIGSFGKEAYAFVDFLVDTGCSYWQILPLCPVDGWNSPYQSVSAFAGNPYLIDLELLAERGLITGSELADNECDEVYAVAYDFLCHTRLPLLRKAFGRLSGEAMCGLEAFERQNAAWLPDYCLYMALRDENEGKEWSSWEEPLRFREDSALAAARERLRGDLQFYAFVQQEFFRQWMALKAYANGRGIKIIGDMPIYVSYESADLWSNRKLFDLADDGAMRETAGVPPDYFSTDGQKWGNPLYDWEAMAEDGYLWWMERIRAALTLYDAVRIDHFRAFSAYWAVPAQDLTAKEGRWRKGPGMDLFGRVRGQFPNPCIIAEDLGCIDDDVRRLIRETGFPGMRVMQFGFLDENDNHHLPHNYTPDSVAYTGTHDNTTLLGWLWEADAKQRDYALEYCRFTGGDWSRGGPESESCRAMIQTLWQSAAALAIVPVQDLCGYGSDTRINHPGVAQGNWAFRMTREGLNAIDRGWVRNLNMVYHRLN